MSIPGARRIWWPGGWRFPNGIVLRPGGKTLLVAESKKNRVLEYPVLAPGKVGPEKVFVDLPEKKAGQIDNQPDGMCLDADGNLYVAHYGMRQVQVVSPEGEVIRRYAGGTLTTSNVAFGGKDRDELYVTGALGDGTGQQGPSVSAGSQGRAWPEDLPAKRGRERRRDAQRRRGTVPLLAAGRGNKNSSTCRPSLP